MKLVWTLGSITSSASSQRVLCSQMLLYDEAWREFCNRFILFIYSFFGRGGQWFTKHGSLGKSGGRSSIAPFSGPRPASRCLQFPRPSPLYRTASDGKLGEGLGTRLGVPFRNFCGVHSQENGVKPSILMQYFVLTHGVCQNHEFIPLQSCVEKTNKQEWTLLADV